MDGVFETGLIVGMYRVVRPLGGGGMGVVYEVEHLKLRTHRALKVFAIGGEHVELHRKRFLSEGKMLAALDHPRIVRVHEFDVDAASGRPYFVMDLVLSPDGTPRTLAEECGVTGGEARAVALFRDICEGLDYVHSLGIVHRDVKLENILIGPDGRAVISDFGISRIFDAELRQKLDITLTMPQDEDVVRHLGSAFYLAPELQGEMPDKATPASDAWALGVMMFRYLTGFWFERQNREKCLSLLADCECPWRLVIDRLCAEAPGERKGAGGFVAFADALEKGRQQPVFRKSKGRLILFGAIALVAVVAGVSLPSLRTDSEASATMSEVDPSVLRVSVNFDDLKLLNGGDDVAIPGVSADTRFLSLSWTEASMAKVQASGAQGADAIAMLVANGEPWQKESQPGVAIDLPHGIDKMWVHGSDAGSSFLQALDVANLNRLRVCVRPDDGFASNRFCLVEAAFSYNSAAQADEALGKLQMRFFFLDPISRLRIVMNGKRSFSLTTSFEISHVNEVLYSLLGSLPGAFGTHVEVYEARAEFTLDFRQPRRDDSHEQAVHGTNDVYSTLFAARLADWRSNRVVNMAVQNYRGKCPSDPTPDDGLVAMLALARIELQTNDKGLVFVYVPSSTSQQAKDLADAYIEAIVSFTHDENERRCEEAVRAIHANIKKKRREIENLGLKFLNLRSSTREHDVAYEIELSKCENDVAVAMDVLKALVLSENTARLDAENKNEIVRVGRPAVVRKLLARVSGK